MRLRRTQDLKKNKTREQESTTNRMETKRDKKKTDEWDKKYIAVNGKYYT